jgi:hypothetical protein
MPKHRAVYDAAHVLAVMVVGESAKAVASDSGAASG